MGALTQLRQWHSEHGGSSCFGRLTAKQLHKLGFQRDMCQTDFVDGSGKTQKWHIRYGNKMTSNWKSEHPDATLGEESTVRAEFMRERQHLDAAAQAMWMSENYPPPQDLPHVDGQEDHQLSTSSLIARHVCCHELPLDPVHLRNVMENAPRSRVRNPGDEK